MTTVLAIDRPLANRLQIIALAVGIVGLIVLVCVAPSDPPQFFRTYLPAFLFFFGLSAGGLALTMIHHLTGGAWGLLVRRICEAQMATLPLVAVLFVPVALGMQHIYPWFTPQAIPESHRLALRWSYMAPGWFVVRSAIYLAVWTILGWVLLAYSRRQDRTAAAYISRRLEDISGPGLVLFGVLMHFAVIDWLMSVETKFTSSILGPIIATSQLLSAFSFAVLIATWFTLDTRRSEIVSLKALNDLGTLQFTFLNVWAYVSWAQFMLIWMANLRRDNVWYVARSVSIWPAVALFLAIFHFGVPFFLLLLKTVKQSVPALRALSLYLLCLHVVYWVYQVLPSYGQISVSDNWMIVFTFPAVGGLWVAAFLALLKRRPLVPRYALDWPHAIHLRELDEEHAAEEALVHG